jgi:hypothetical protein
LALLVASAWSCNNTKIERFYVYPAAGAAADDDDDNDDDTAVADDDDDADDDNDDTTVGACCSANGSCAEETQGYCNRGGGTWCAGRTCADKPCELGACCASGQGCVEEARVYCDLAGGVFSGGKTCSEAPCPLGACCVTYADCVDGQTNSACNADSGVWYDGKTCADGPCEFGACCNSGNCTDYSLQPACVNGGGVWQKYEYCSDDPCSWPPGACCNFDERTCVDDQSQSACAATWYAGENCETGPCSPGACCLGNMECSESYYAQACAEAGGQFLSGQECIPEVTCDWYGDDDNDDNFTSPGCSEDSCFSQAPGTNGNIA